MKYRLDVAPSAVKEARKVYLYREKDKEGSGDRFVKELIECYASIKADPYHYQIRKEPFRHAFLYRLKIRVVFMVDGELISVVQVRHTSRKVSKKFGP